MNIEKYLSAINKRSSRRKYINKPIDNTYVKTLKKSINSYNEISNLNIKIVTETGGEIFDGFRKSYGLFSGVRNYIAMIGKQDDPDRMEKVGRYGELLVLEATDMGLSTCWVGMSYDRKTASYLKGKDEVLDCVIAIGYADEKYSLKERFIENSMHKKNDLKESLIETTEDLPEWFLNGMKAVSLAPSARNLKPFLFKYKDGQVKVLLTSQSKYSIIDLGIAKLHFELGSGRIGRWDFGNDAVYHLNIDMVDE